jgi:protein-L-isoaspartate(D-aspartate) O-methyltransferase
MDTDKMRAMLRTIENEFRHTGGLTGRSAPRQQTLDAVALVPREEFVPAHLRPFAYDNTPLPIGDGQTISQPFIVALMTDLLEPTPESVILEVGAGSGYQAAVLAQLAGQVYSMEIIPALARQAAGRLQKLGIGNVEIIVDDGSHGLPAHAPGPARAPGRPAPPAPGPAAGAEKRRGNHLPLRPAGGLCAVYRKSSTGLNPVASLSVANPPGLSQIQQKFPKP